MANKVKIKEKTPNTSRRIIYAVIALVVVLIPAAYFYSFSLTQTTEAKAAIIDQLGSSKLGEAIRDENQTFINATREILNKRFSFIDYYSDNATVEQYRQLASAGYKLIVWRAHSALDLNSKYIAISTTDNYSSGEYEQYPDGSLTLCSITGDPTLYFGITPKFIQQVMTGTFQDTVIILMSCNGLNQTYIKTAQALEAKGAKVIISWDDWVSSSDNDYGTTLLLQHLIEENKTVDEAVSKISPFPSEFALTTLRYDPHTSEAAGYRIPDYRKNNTTQSATIVLVLFRKIEPTLSNLPLELKCTRRRG